MAELDDDVPAGALGVEVDDGVEADELVLLDELPHPLSASTLTARASVEAFGSEPIE